MATPCPEPAHGHPSITSVVLGGFHSAVFAGCGDGWVRVRVGLVRPRPRSGGSLRVLATSPPPLDIASAVTCSFKSQTCSRGSTFCFAWCLPLPHTHTSTRRNPLQPARSSCTSFGISSSSDHRLLRTGRPARQSPDHPIAGRGGGGHTANPSPAAGIVFIWGLNDNGQLGQGDDIQRSTPTILPPKGALTPPSALQWTGVGF